MLCSPTPWSGRVKLGSSMSQSMSSLLKLSNHLAAMVTWRNTSPLPSLLRRHFARRLETTGGVTKCRLFSQTEKKKHFWKVFCSGTVTFSKTIRFYLFPSLVEFFFISIVPHAFVGREKGRGIPFHPLFSSFALFSLPLPPLFFAPATQAKILHVKQSEIPLTALGYFWFATTWQGGHVWGQYNIIFFSKNLHENRVKFPEEITNMATVTSRGNQQFLVKYSHFSFDCSTTTCPVALYQNFVREGN